jgi:hypothetical protein
MTDLIQFNSALPDYVKAKADSFPDTISENRIKFNGKAIHVVIDGRESDKALEIPVVLVAKNQSKLSSRKFYIGKWNSDSADAPACWSADGVIPSATSAQVQATSCATCPQSQKGSGETYNGARTTACKQFRKIVVAPYNTLKTAPIPLALQLSAKSVGGYADDGKSMTYRALMEECKKKGIDPEACEWILTTDDGNTSPVATFKFVKFLDGDEYAASRKLAAQKATQDMTVVSFTSSADKGDEFSTPQLLAPSVEPPVVPVIVQAMTEVLADVEKITKPKKAKSAPAPASVTAKDLVAKGYDEHDAERIIAAGVDTVQGKKLLEKYAPDEPIQVVTPVAAVAEAGKSEIEALLDNLGFDD